MTVERHYTRLLRAPRHWEGVRCPPVMEAEAVAAMACPGAVPLKTARMSTGVTIKQDSANMPSAVAEAPAAARYVADVWRLNAASRLQTQMESKRGTARLN